MNINELITNNLEQHIFEKYVKYYFHEMVRLKNTKQINYTTFDNGFISIMKDEIDRKEKGSGKLREKPWSNFLFYFINKSDFQNLFGTNEKHRDIKSVDFSGEINFKPFEFNAAPKKPNALYSNSKNNYKIARSIFEKIKNDNSYLFVRSYVYITIILYNDAEASVADFLTYYFNTNYKFTETNGKRRFITNVNNSYLVEDLNHELSNIKDNNRDIFDCVKAYNNTLDYTNLTAANVENIDNSISDENEYIIIEGSARTGKTIIAMTILRKYNSANLLVMNRYFYLALKDAFGALNIEFPANRIFHQSRGKVGYYDGVTKMNFDFCIIDECQRLGKKFNLVNRMTSSPTHINTLFLGDNLQRLKPSSDDGISYIKDKLEVNNKRFILFKFTSSIGIPPEITKNIKYLLDDPTIVSPHFLGEYNIRIFDNKEEFLTSYENDNHKNKHLATIHYPSNDFSSIGKYRALPKSIKDSTYPYFLNNEIINKYFLSPFELISREVESIYIYIRKNITINNRDDFVFYQLYVLMTRATMSLNIYFDDEKLNTYFKNRLAKIIDFSSKIDNSVENCVKFGQFEVSESILEEFKMKYNIDTPQEKIKERNITRLVHFTEKSNIPSIIKYGLLPKKDLDEARVNYDNNDNDRWDGHPDSICLSVENPNQLLLEKYKKTYPNKKYKLITINPSILYSIYCKNEEIKLLPRLYTNYNAASNSKKISENDIDIMFSHKVQIFYWKYGNSRIFTRDNLDDNQPTCTQAEILFFGKIPPEYIESIEDI